MSKTTKMVLEEIKVVNGEENLIDGLKKKAIEIHNDLEKEFEKGVGE